MATRTALCRLDAGLFKRTDEGYLQAKVNPTRVGVFAYYDAESGKVIKELRPPEEVGRADSLPTLNHKVATDDHPPALLNARTTKQYQAGFMSADHVMDADGIHTLSQVTITDADLIAKIEGGKQQVSCGYTCDIEDTPGMWNGERYDRIQRNIKYNHLAIVHRGRAGSAALRADSATVTRFDAWEVDDDPPPTDPPSAPVAKEDSQSETPSMNRRKPMAMIPVDGQDYECSDVLKVVLTNKFKADAAALETAEKAAESAKTEAQKARQDAESAKSEADKTIGELKGRLDEANGKILTPDALEKLIEQRSDSLNALKEKAVKVLGRDYDFKGKSEHQIKLDAVTKARPAFKLDSVPEAERPTYLNARFDAVTEDLGTSRNDVLDALDHAKSRTDSDFWAADALAD